MAFLVFEGLDGAGKSTLIQGVSSHLKSRDLESIVTREPGGTILGDELREIVTRTKLEAPTPRTELLLYEASRAQHVDRVIRPALDKGHWVLCDRFTASSVAFQGGGRDIPTESVHWLNDFATDSTKPDLQILLDLPTEESLSRIQKRQDSTGQDTDRFEREAKEFHEAVRKSYLKQANDNKEKWLILDAMEQSDSLLQTLIQELVKRQWLKS